MSEERRCAGSGSDLLLLVLRHRLHAFQVRQLTKVRASSVTFHLFHDRTARCSSLLIRSLRHRSFLTEARNGRDTMLLHNPLNRSPRQSGLRTGIPVLCVCGRRVLFAALPDADNDQDDDEDHCNRRRGPDSHCLPHVVRNTSVVMVSIFCRSFCHVADGRGGQVRVLLATAARAASHLLPLFSFLSSGHEHPYITCFII